MRNLCKDSVRLGIQRFLQKLFFMKNVCLRKIDFYVIFSVVWCKLNHFARIKGKISTELFNWRKNIKHMVVAEIDADQMKKILRSKFIFELLLIFSIK